MLPKETTRKTKWFAILGVSVLLAVVALTIVILQHREEKERRALAIARMYGGEATRATVANARHAVAYRLGPPPSGTRDSTAVTDYPITAGPISIPAAVVPQIVETLTSSAPHGHDAPKGCSPMYGVRIHVDAGAEKIDVLLCFECAILLVYRNGGLSGGENFEFIRPSLVRAVKLVFPADEEIQALDEDHPTGPRFKAETPTGDQKTGAT